MVVSQQPITGLMREGKLMKTDEQIIKMWHSQHGAWSHGGSKQLTNTRDMQQFYAGDFMSYTDRLQYADGRGNKKSTMVQFNKVKPYVNAVRGFMAQNRQKADYSARHENSQMQQFYTKYSNSYKDNLRQQCHADQIETQQDGDMLICGYGAVDTAISYGEGHSTTNPNGELLMGRIDPQIVYWDYTARASNLLDARYCGYKKVYALEEALSLFDGSTPEDFEYSQNDDQGNKVYYKRGGTYNKIQELYDVEQGKEELIRVYFHQWYEIEPFYRAVNPLQGNDIDPSLMEDAVRSLLMIAEDQENPDDPYKFDPQSTIITCDKKTMKMVKALFEGIAPIEFEKFNRKVFYTAILSGNTVFKAYRSASQQGFTLKFKTGDYDESNKMWVGMVNSLRDPALYYNKALTEMLWVIASQAKGGVMAERSAIKDIAAFEAKYAKTDGVAIVEDGALSGSRIKPKKEGYQPTGIENILSEAGNSLPEVSGIDKSFLGSSENKNQTAALQGMQIRQVQSTLATYFDSITLYSQEWAKMAMPFLKILAENNDGSEFKTTDDNDGSTVYLQLTRENFLDEYDINLVEAPTSQMQKMEQGATLQAVATQLMQNPQTFAAGVQALIAAIKLMAIDFVDRQNITKALMPQQGNIDPAYVQKLEQTVHQLMDEGNKAEITEKLSKAHLNMMSGAEKISNIKKNNAEAKLKGAETEKTDVEAYIMQNQPDTNPQTEINV
jgi:hypothetical protein